MLDLDRNRQAVAPRDAATLLVARNATSPSGGPAGGIEVFCVERRRGGFLGGAVVFPGGQLDPSDLDPNWDSASTPPRSTAVPIAADDAALRGLAIAACREALEEAAILPLVGPALAHEELLTWQARLAQRSPGQADETLLPLLAARGLRLDLGALHPFARWVTPIAEARRFDTRFFLFVSDDALIGAHDDNETTASFWASPAEVLAGHATGSLVLAPPTHRTLEVFARARDTAHAVAIADGSCLEPICPLVVQQRDPAGDTVAIVLPGDPEHDVREPRVPGRSRYVLRGGRFLSEDAPR
jgi:8-oxo-dGTP pyrophosphatase MutT (NUDIX family)